MRPSRSRMMTSPRHAEEQASGMSPRALVGTCLFVVLAFFGCANDAGPAGNVGPERSESADSLVESPPQCEELSQVHVCRLDNGVRLLLASDPTQSDVALSVVYGVGAKDEGPHEVGMAHMLEHMLFRGSEQFPEPRAEIRRVGGATNAVTEHDSTRYVTRLPAGPEPLDLALRIEADRMAGGPHLTAEDLAIEKGVVQNELDGRAGNAHVALQRSIYASAFQWHGYGRSVIGPRPSIAEIEPDELRAFYRRYYHPANATVIVAGAVDLDSAKASIQRTIGRVPSPSRDPIPRAAVREPQQQGAREIILHGRATSPIVGALYHGIAATNSDYPAVRALREILTEGRESRLHRALVGSGLATRIAGASRPTADPGGLYIVADAAPGVSREALQDALDRELRELANGIHPVTEQEVERIRRAATRERDTTALKTTARLSSFVSAGDWRLAVAVPRAVAAIEPTDVDRVARALLRPSNRTTGILLPGEMPDFAPWTEDEPSRDWIASYVEPTSTPTSVEPDRFELTAATIEQHVERSTPPEGPELVTLATPGTGDRIHARLSIPIDDPSSSASASAAWSLAPMLVMNGRGRNGDASLVDELARMGTELEVLQSAGRLEVSLVTTPEQLTASLQRAVETLREPRVAPEVLAESVHSRLTTQQQRKTDPTKVAVDRALRWMNGGSFPKEFEGPLSEDQVRALPVLTVDEVETLYRETLVARSAVLVVVGDFDPSSVRGVIDVGWGPRSYAGTGDTEAPSDTVPPQIREDVPGSDVGVALLAQRVTMSDEDPDFPALQVAMRVLGGSGGSLLDRRLREQEGYSYETGASFHGLGPHGWGPLMVFATTSAQNVTAGLAALREETARFVSEGITPEELEVAKKHLVQTRATLLGRGELVCIMLTRAAVRGRTLAYDEQLSRRIEALTVEEVNAAVRRHLRPESMMSVIAADRSRMGNGEQSNP